jgi:hypothetical protein
LARPTVPISEEARALLAPPATPGGSTRGTPAAATALFCVGGGLALLNLLQNLQASPDLSSQDDSYQLGYQYGGFIIAAILVFIGLVIKAAASDPNKAPAPQAQAEWEFQQYMWRASWLCQQCRVAFYPESVFVLGSPASPAIPLQQFQTWVRTGRGPQPTVGS